MLMLRRAVFVLLAGLLMPAAAHAASLNEQVKAAYATYDATFNSDNARALAQLYTENALLLPPSHDVIKGRAGIRKFFAGLFAAGVHDHKLELIYANGQGGVIVAAARWSAKAEDGSSLGGIAVHEFVRQGGKLKLKLHTFN